MNNNDVVPMENAKTSDQTVLSLLMAAHALEDKVEATLSSVGLSMPKFSVLNALVATGEPVSLSELASRLSCVKSNMTQLIDRLEAEGLVRRVPDPRDRRAVRAEITELGRERHQAGEAQIARLDETFAARVLPTDHAAMERMLAALK